MDQAINKAAGLVEALSYIQRFHDKVVVVKVGGSIMDDEEALSSILTDIVFMNYVGMQPVLVHGGGKAINQAMEKAGLVPQMGAGPALHRRAHAGDRRARAVQPDQQVHRQLHPEPGVRGDGAALALAASCCSPRRRTCRAPTAGGSTWGWSARSRASTPGCCNCWCRRIRSPCIATIARDQAGGKLNVNADTAAGAVAAAMKAEKLVVVSDTHGIRSDPKDPDSRVSHLTVAQIDEMVKSGVITAGMLPKVEACITALRGGVTKTHIIDGRIPHSLLLEIYTEAGIGTEIVL